MDYLYVGLLFTAVGAFFLFIAHHFSFFKVKDLREISIDLRFPLIGMIGYLMIFFVIAPLSVQFLGSSIVDLMTHSPALLMTLLQLLALAWVITYLFCFSILQKREVMKGIWIHPERARFKCLIEDFGLGLLTWLISFPVVVAISQYVEALVFFFTGYTGMDQVAIRFLKMAKESPYLLVIALFAILIAAPIIEEFVFRGILYTYLKKKVKRMGALIISSIVFAAFHFSPDQGLSNFSLLFSLFTLALFLGFLYERQRSLLAPIALHMTFNSISVIRILLISS
ncbi:MAG: CPBP family intramembrane metalloprotease [Simkaniaceae bacterium]|nr:MAG: CPBP family intramembrane metalloprotease [Simkaniaceae bacterium]